MVRGRTVTLFLRRAASGAVHRQRQVTKPFAQVSPDDPHRGLVSRWSTHRTAAARNDLELRGAAVERTARDDAGWATRTT
jgi:hypothetical protein